MALSVSLCSTAPPKGATATTAASGGNRESLLGQRPARRKRSAADAGCRNPGSVTEGDGEGKDAAKQLLHSDSIALTKNLLIAAQKLFCPGLALSGATRQLSQRESPWHVGQVYAGRAKHDVPGTVVLRCLGSRQLDKERCPEVAALCSEARSFASYQTLGVQSKAARHASGSPSGGAGKAIRL